MRFQGFGPVPLQNPSQIFICWFAGKFPIRFARHKRHVCNLINLRCVVARFAQYSFWKNMMGFNKMGFALVHQRQSQTRTPILGSSCFECEIRRRKERALRIFSDEILGKRFETT